MLFEFSYYSYFPLIICEDKDFIFAKETILIHIKINNNLNIKRYLMRHKFCCSHLFEFETNRNYYSIFTHNHMCIFNCRSISQEPHFNTFCNVLS